MLRTEVGKVEKEERVQEKIAKMTKLGVRVDVECRASKHVWEGGWRGGKGKREAKTARRELSANIFGISDSLTSPPSYAG
jgi:hypothetical protein